MRTYNCSELAALGMILLCACAPDDKGGEIIAKERDSSIRDSQALDARSDAQVDGGSKGDAGGVCVVESLADPDPMNMACSAQLVPCINACADNGDQQCVLDCWQMEPESCQVCISERAIFCASKGTCMSQYQAYYCCGEDSDCNADPETCANDLCSAHRQNLESCVNADQTCLSQAILECSPNP